VSGGAGDVDDLIEVTTEPALIPSPLQQFYEAKFGQEVHMTLYGPDTAVKG
jgi:hypothetical protein